MKKRTAWGLAAIPVGLVMVGASCEQKRRPDRYLIPDGYVGLVHVRYRVSDAPPLPLEDGFYLVKFPRSGVLKTSSAMEGGWAKNEYYYYSGVERRPLKLTGWGEGGMIWAGTAREWGDNHSPQLAELTFFVGTEARWPAAFSLMRLSAATAW